MLPFVPVSSRTVLEVGCGSGEFAANLKLERKVHVTGIEPFLAAATEASVRLDELIHGDVDSGISKLKGRSFDCIVCNDVLEHLKFPWETLKKLHPLLTPGGVLVLSIPNMRFLPVLKELVLHGNWQYTDDGVMDRTHFRFFTKKSIMIMLKDCGYFLNKMEGINALPFSRKFYVFNKLMAGKYSDLRFLQFACVASTASANS